MKFSIICIVQCVTLVSTNIYSLSTAQCGCGKCAYRDIISHGCKEPRDGINFPFIDTREMSESEKDILLSRLIKEAEKIFNEFDLLIEEYNTWLEAHEVKFELYQQVLQNIRGYEALSVQKSDLLENRKEDIRKATTFQDLGDIVNDYVNWFSYSLLNIIIERVGRKINKSTDDFRDKVENYNSALQMFCQRSIYECPMPCTLYPSNKHIKYLCVKVQMPDQHYMNLKATKISKFQADISEVFGLSSYTLKLCSIAQGCVEVLFSIPTSIHATLFPLQSDILNKLIPLGVIKICTDGYAIEWDKISQCFHSILHKVHVCNICIWHVYAVFIIINTCIQYTCTCLCDFKSHD